MFRNPYLPSWVLCSNYWWNVREDRYLEISTSKFWQLIPYVYLWDSIGATAIALVFIRWRGINMQLHNRLEESQEKQMQNTLLLKVHRVKGEIHLPLFSFFHHSSTYGSKMGFVWRRDRSKVAYYLFYFTSLTKWVISQLFWTRFAIQV